MKCCSRRFVALVAAFLPCLVRPDPIPSMSFGGPFDGNQLPGWSLHGSAQVGRDAAQFFGRVPRENTRGAIWSEGPQNLNEFSAVLQIKVKGEGVQGSKAGLGVFFAQDKFSEGELYGAAENFKGFGILLQKFKGSEGIDGIKELTVVVNEVGEKTFGQMMGTAEGCKISPIFVGGESMVTIKVMVYQDVLFVLHDLYNSGHYTECTALAMNIQGKLSLAYTGFSSTNGAGSGQFFELPMLSMDTRWDAHGALPEHEHDISDGPAVELEPEEMNMEEELRKMQMHEWAAEQRLELLEVDLQQNVQNRLAELEAALKTKTDQAMVDKIAHWEATLKDSAEQALVERIAALERKIHNDVEQKLVDRIMQLEKRISDVMDQSHSSVANDLDNSMAGRLNQVEMKIKEAMESHLSNQLEDRETSTRAWVGKLAQKMDARNTESIQNVKETINRDVMADVTSRTAGWQTPFYVLLVLMVVVCFVGYRWYVHMRKTHLL